MPDAIDFDELYRRDPDPFAVATRWYERRKIAVVLAALARPRYDVAWDCACGTGELAAALADAYVSGANAVDELGAAVTAAGWRGTVRHDDEDFVLTAWQRRTDVR